jgi:hypothetical protein
MEVRQTMVQMQAQERKQELSLELLDHKLLVIKKY